MTVDGERRDLLLRLLHTKDSVEVASLVVPPGSPSEIDSTVAPIRASTGLEVTWLVVNGHRLDATVLSAGGREWRVVLGTDDGVTVRYFHAVEKPRRFDGVPGGRAVILNGPSSAGKSTLMQQLQADATTPWVMFDELSFGSVPSGYLIWRDTAGPLRRGFLAGIAALAAEGNQVVLSAGGFPQQDFVNAFAAVPTLYVGLDCALDVLVERQRGRDDRWGGLAEGSLGCHDGWRYDVRLDSGRASPGELAAEIFRALE